VCTTATGCKKGTESAVAGGMYFPTGIAWDSDGDLVFADIRIYRIDEFTAAGTFVRAFGEGVIDGGSSFQICTTATGCRAGLSSSNPGSLPFPYGVAIDCKGAIYASTLGSGTGFLQIKRFGEPSTETPPCPLPPQTPGSPSSSSSSSADVLGPPPSTQKPKTGKPKLTIELNKGSGTASLEAIVPTAGTLQLHGKGIRKAKKSTKRPGLLELVIAPTKKVKAKLEDTGKATVKVIVGFVPDQGDSSTQAKSVTLKMARLFWG
ncbi:MAG TPA: hypothetical protein VHV50_05370, partial [Actinomycetota bacterium]|nr:hypothetical protein [Actinomycetota bacterium]